MLLSIPQYKNYHIIDMFNFKEMGQQPTSSNIDIVLNVTAYKAQ